MPPERSRTEASNPNPEREAGTSSGSTHPPIDADLPRGTPCGFGTPFQPAVSLQRPDTQPKPSADQPSDACARQTKEDRTHLVWMPAGGIPSITCTSPTPPPPARRVRRCHPSFTRAHDAPGLLGRKRSHHSPHPTNRNTDSERDPGVESVSEKEDDDARVPEQMADHSLDAADPSGPSRRRTLADYDRTNARIRALNAELLSDPSSQWSGDPSHTSARRTPRPSVRYLNIPRAAIDALSAYRPRSSESRTRASSGGTGIVDISESESSEFESDEEGEESDLAFTPGGAETAVAARSERPERAVPLGLPAEHQDCVTVAGPQNSITRRESPTDAYGPQRHRLRAGPFLRDRAAEDDRPQPGHIPFLLQNDAPPPSEPRPTPIRQQDKKRSRDPETDEDRVHVAAGASDSLAREGKRRKVALGASMSAT